MTEIETTDVFDVDSQAEITRQWLEEYKKTITPSNARKLENRLERNKEKCPSDDFKLIYFNGEKNISLFAKECSEEPEDGSTDIKVQAAGFYGLALGFCHTFDSLHSAVFFFYSIKSYWETEIDAEQKERDRTKKLSSIYIKEGERFEGGFVVEDTWGNFVVNIRNEDTGETLSKRLSLVNDKLYVENEGEYFKLL